MKQIFIFIFLISFNSSFGQKLSTYPLTEKIEVIDTIWHKRITDPYRWLEEINSDKTKEWLKGQEVIKDKYASKLASNIAEHLSNHLNSFPSCNQMVPVKILMYYITKINPDTAAVVFLTSG